jgi:hypothetical protein
MVKGYDSAKAKTALPALHNATQNHRQLARLRVRLRPRCGRSNRRLQPQRSWWESVKGFQVRIRTPRT